MHSRPLAPEVQAYIERAGPQEQAIIQSLIAALLAAEPGLDLDIKWRRITLTMHGNWHHWICGIEVTKRYVSLQFHKGWLLDDPAGALEGTGPHLRTIRFTSPDHVDPAVLAPLVKDAVAKQLDM